MRNVIISLYDPQLDNEGNASRSPCLSVCKDNPATDYYLIYETRHEKGAKNIIESVKTEMRKSVRKHIAGGAKRDEWLKGIAVTPVAIDYGDVWDFTKCIEKLAGKKDEYFNKCADTNKIIANCSSGTAAQRAALYLTLLKFAEENRDSPSISCKAYFSKHRGGEEKCISVAGNGEPCGILKEYIGTSDNEFRKKLDNLERIVLRSRFDNILLTGNTGTGKTMLASFIIKVMQARFSDEVKDENCIVQNVAAIPENLMESILCGHEKGSFTGAEEQHKGIFERADRGIVFLDEIGELRSDLQAKLLTILDGQPFYRVGGKKPIESSFMLICGTNRNLEEECRKGKFRFDLYQRLNTWSIHMPDLHERPREDFVLALQRAMGIWCQKHDCTIDFDSKKTRERFLELAKNVPWHGNYREFNAAIAHLAMPLKPKERITAEAIEEELRPKMETELDAPSVLKQTGLGSYDLCDLAKLACALDACKTSRTADEAGRQLFAARCRKTEEGGGKFNGSAYLQRIFKEFGLKLVFEHGIPKVVLLESENQHLSTADS